jgi:hypothetical protein
VVWENGKVTVAVTVGGVNDDGRDGGHDHLQLIAGDLVLRGVGAVNVLAVHEGTGWRVRPVALTDSGVDTDSAHDADARDEANSGGTR